eukprot:535781_1
MAMDTDSPQHHEHHSSFQVEDNHGIMCGAMIGCDVTNKCGYRQRRKGPSRRGGDRRGRKERLMDKIDNQNKTKLRSSKVKRKSKDQSNTSSDEDMTRCGEPGEYSDFKTSEDESIQDVNGCKKPQLKRHKQANKMKKSRHKSASKKRRNAVAKIPLTCTNDTRIGDKKRYDDSTRPKKHERSRYKKYQDKKRRTDTKHKTYNRSQKNKREESEDRGRWMDMDQD